MHRLVIATWFLLLVAPCAHASQPGQPLDCTDWVILAEGLRCETLVPFPCGYIPGQEKNSACYVGNNARAVDNANALLRFKRVDTPTSCGTSTLYRSVVLEYRGDVEHVLAYVDDRCVTTAPLQIDRFHPDGHNSGDHSDGVIFDPIAGRLIFAASQSLESPGIGYVGYSLVALAGFTTLNEVTMTYVPSQGSFAYRLPIQPEGLQAAAQYNTYWGRVALPLDLANAHPLQCAYPSSPANPGDYLQITAPVPTPTPGSANYILTSVTYQGQTRAGRKASGGRLSGRDASRLPACLE